MEAKPLLPMESPSSADGEQFAPAQAARAGRPVQACFLKIPWSPSRSFQVKEWRGPLIDAPWHYHPEYEITLVLAGSGTRCIGNALAPFAAGDLVMIGPNLPHFWRYSGGRQNGKAHSVVLLFSDDCLGRDFFKRPELRLLSLLLELSKSGLQFFGRTRDEVLRRMARIPRADGPDLIIQFLEILRILSKTQERQVLSGTAYEGEASIHFNERIDRVCRHIVEHFQDPIDLAKMAALANMTPAAFCRYFKKLTRLTLSAFTNLVRTEHAGKLLAETDLAVTEICFASGYSSISNFNRRFRKLKGISPTDYRERFQSQTLGPPAHSGQHSPEGNPPRM